MNITSLSQRVKQAIKRKAEEPVDANVYARAVEKKAYELDEKRGGQDGYDWDDWLEAERLVEKEFIGGK